MTVEELIEKLKQYPPNTEVKVPVRGPALVLGDVEEVVFSHIGSRPVVVIDG